MPKVGSQFSILLRNCRFKTLTRCTTKDNFEQPEMSVHSYQHQQSVHTAQLH